jgi:hypothetical protein
VALRIPSLVFDEFILQYEMISLHFSNESSREAFTDSGSGFKTSFPWLHAENTNPNTTNTAITPHKFLFFMMNFLCGLSRRLILSRLIQDSLQTPDFSPAVMAHSVVSFRLPVVRGFGR